MGMSIDDYASSLSSYSDLYSNASSIGNELQTKLNSTDYSSVSKEELMEACKSFEQYFVEQMYKSMEKMIPKDEDESSTATAYMDMFGDTLTQEYAKLATNSGNGEGIGIASMLYEQMKRNYGFE